MAVTPPPTLLQTVRDVPLESYHTDTLRRLIAQSRAVLRDRGLIPDASLRSRDTPDFTQSDCHAIRVAARRFACSPVALAEELLRLRAQPRIVTLHPREGPAARLTPLLRVHWSQRTGTVLTGTGQLFCDLRLAYRWSVPDLATGEYVLLQADGQPARPARDSREEPLRAFARVFGAGFVRAWDDLPQRPTATALRIILAQAAHDDTPQEALLTWCIRAVARRLEMMVENGALVDQLLLQSLPTFTLADLLRPALREVRMGADPLSVAHTPQRGDWYHRLLRAIELFLVSTNLIAPDLETDPILAIPLVQLWQWYARQEHLASVRAHHLRAAVVARFGFQEIQWQEGRAWVKTEPRLPLDTSRYQVPELLKKQPHVLVTDACRVYVNGQYCCVVEGRSADLPQADQVVRRLLAVATAHRLRIHTLTKDLPILEQLFADTTEQRLWPLLRELQASTPTLH